MAGVAPSTVTRALKGDTRISKKTREHILRLAKEHGYMPNALARTLSSGRSGLYGLVLGSSENPFYVELLHEATRQAEKLGYRLLIIHAGAGPIEDTTAQALIQYQVDGCIISSAILSSHAAAICAQNNVPLVMVNRVALQHGCFVTCDNRAGGAEIARLMMASGRQRFALVSTSSPSSTSREREEGFTAELARQGLALVQRYDGQSHYDGGFAAGQKIADVPAESRPDAVFALSDIMAMGLLDALRIAAIDVPGEIAVAGFDGLPSSARPIYDLTTIQQPLPLMIQRAFEMLQARMVDPSLPDESVSLCGRLLSRGSTGTP